MSNVDTRQVDRDSLFLLAQLRVGESDKETRVKVRNLSAGGMMAEGEVSVSRGQLVKVELRNLGWIEGSVAWKQENRFGIAFPEEIDPRKARAPLASQVPSPISAAHRPSPASAPPPQDKLRKL